MIVVAAASGAILYLQTRHAARTQADAMTAGSWRRGELAIARYQCGSCHIIPGISGATGAVGPDLTGVGTRAIIAGDQSNDPVALARFIAHPQRVRPGGAMPEMGVSDGEARDIAAYLYAQE
ncbi:c-type cytochrome [Sphingomonas floccifaciens]|uniref:C-type cytochrome n=1 Tax=Sphingomonas floccifaciens TaxID=1844115 RepID=A0ABW4N7X0_9SPHN